MPLLFQTSFLSLNRPVRLDQEQSLIFVILLLFRSQKPVCSRVGTQTDNLQISQHLWKQHESESSWLSNERELITIEFRAFVKFDLDLTCTYLYTKLRLQLFHNCLLAICIFLALCLDNFAFGDAFQRQMRASLDIRQHQKLVSLHPLNSLVDTSCTVPYAPLPSCLTIIISVRTKRFSIVLAKTWLTAL